MACLATATPPPRPIFDVFDDSDNGSYEKSSFGTTDKAVSHLEVDFVETVFSVRMNYSRGISFEISFLKVGLTRTW